MTLYRQKLLDYGSFGLSCNPFSKLVPDERVKFILQRDSETERSLWALRPALEGVSTNVVVVGGYGNGKTHLLKYVHYLVSSREGRRVLPIYVNSPGENFRRLYSSVMLSLGQEALQNLVWRYLAIIAAEEWKDFKLTEQERSELTKDDPPIRKYVQVGKVLFPKLVTKARNDMLRRIPLIDYSTALLHLIVEENAFVAWKWLCGEDVPSEQRRDLGLSMSINNDERSLRGLLSLKGVAHKVGFGVLAIFLDEFEMLSTLTEYRRQQALNEIRHLIDLAPSGLSIYVACAPEAWRTVVEHYHAFLDRFSHVIYLNPLTEDQTLSLVEAYLRLARVGKAPDSGLRPFTPDAVKLVNRYCMGNVRNTIRLCQQALDYGLAQGAQILSKEVVQRVLESMQLEPLSAE